ncbi:hypothetical protein NQ317_013117 [Molorchus minor]|uniref:Uncharacterized protein n=1 Tax=Molorchus minor TaxID=1323400 RepID=A0ABQ9JVN0_9CUCU|nr:hypothetical protein NQ317_013117 [Molorchus minor]
MYVFSLYQLNAYNQLCNVLCSAKLFTLLTYSWCKSNVCLLGKTALVTGGCSVIRGIGYETVLALVSRGCRVIVADIIDDPELKERIFKETNSNNIEYKYVDLGSFKSVRELAKDLLKTEEKLDILINNAGVGYQQVVVTDDDLDLTMQINYFSGNSKLAVIIAADIFAQKLKQYNITCNSFHPGLVYTTIFRTSTRGAAGIRLIRLLLLECVAMFFGKTPQGGAHTSIYLACANEVNQVTGKFFSETKTTFKPLKAADRKFCEDIWKASEEIVKLEKHLKL